MLFVRSIKFPGNSLFITRYIDNKRYIKTFTTLVTLFVCNKNILFIMKGFMSCFNVMVSNDWPVEYLNVKKIKIDKITLERYQDWHSGDSRYSPHTYVVLV